MICENTKSDCQISNQTYLISHWEPICYDGNCRRNYDIPFRMFVNGSCEPVKYYDRGYKYGSNPIRRDCKLNEYQWKWKWSKEECYVSAQWFIQNKSSL